MTEPGPLDEPTAWRLLRALAPSVDGRGSASLGGPDGRLATDVALTVDAFGAEWETSRTPTRAARELLDLFLPLRIRPSFVVGQLGQSLDGRIATEGGHSHYVTGPDDIRRLHRLRALADAVVVGAGTVASDDPRLTVREVEGNHPLRVVVGGGGRLGPDRSVFGDGTAPTLWIRAAGRGGPPATGGDGAGTPASRPGGPPPVEHLELPADADGIEPARILEALAARGARRVLVEGGGTTVSRFLQAGALDRLHVTVAPLLIGSGRPSLTLPPVATLADAIRPPVRHFLLGRDVLFDLDLRGHGVRGR